MADLFRVPSATNLVGKRSLRELERIAHYLSYSFRPLLLSPPRYDARLAPSVIARSELLLFDLDIPRFCLRVYFDASTHSSFANVRRMREATDRIRDYEWCDYMGPIVCREPRELGADGDAPFFEEVYAALPINERERALTYLTDAPPSAVADCLLRPPDKLAEVFDIVYAELGWVYGEQKSIVGVPYVRPLAAFGGTACAQSCAFMISASLTGRQDDPAPSHREHASVHGLAEITAITSPDDQRFLKLAGLRGSSLLSYFSKVGRSAFHYTWADADPIECCRSLFRCISMHVRAGFACVLPCRSDGGEQGDWDHAVVAIGTRKWIRGRSKLNLLVNNPETRPFEQWDHDEIRAHVTRPIAGGGVQAAMISVLPSAVRLPLARACVYDRTESYVLGVLELARVLAAELPDEEQPLPVPVVTQFYLCRIQIERHGTDHRVGFPPEASGLPRHIAFRDAWEQSPIVRALAGRWCWLQVQWDPDLDVGKVTLWDAERSPLPFEFAKRAAHPAFVPTIRRFVLAQFSHAPGHPWSARAADSGLRDTADAAPGRYVKTDGRMSIRAQAPAMRRGLWSRLFRRSREPALRPAVITSFSPNSLEESCASWPGGIDAAELYAFMHRDERLLEPLHRHLPPRKPNRTAPSAVMLLAGIQDAPEKQRKMAIEQLAGNIHHEFHERCPGVRIGALATYVPQLYSLRASTSLEGERALLTALEFAEALRDRGHEVRTIEVVAGNTIEGLVPARHPQDGEFLFAKRRVGSDVHDFVLGRIRRLCVAALERLPSKFFDHTSISLELEPGPLFALNGLPQLHKFAAAIAADPLLAGIVGFNIDIAHCALAGIPAAAVFGAPGIANRISHFHVSDHGIGHFGDVPIGDCGFGRDTPLPADRVAVFDDWISAAWRFAAEYRERPKPAATSIDPHDIRRRSVTRRPVFSGLISVELEAAQSDAAVARSCDVLRELLRSAMAIASTRAMPASRPLA